MSKRRNSDSDQDEKDIQEGQNIRDRPSCSRSNGEAAEEGACARPPTQQAGPKRPRLDHSHLLVITGTSLRRPSSNGTSSNQVSNGIL